jgi:hypothetical protein
VADEKDYAADVTKYADTVNTAALKGIVRYCGIALHKRDSSLTRLRPSKTPRRLASGPVIDQRQSTGKRRSR